ncbi:MAG TPA: cytochrome c oxidase assembly protein, partial [Gaiellaceae bacterium]|nr:cytochrome c oxidase assembly protein [Gaiellaceae bacterium]
MSVPPLVACALAALLYALGGRGRWRGWREWSFYAGVAVVLLALEPPFDGWADTSFALHMSQHVLLMTVAPPLLVLGRPWPRMWLPFPLQARRAAARGLARDRWSAP